MCFVGHERRSTGRARLVGHVIRYAGARGAQCVDREAHGDGGDLERGFSKT